MTSSKIFLQFWDFDKSEKSKITAVLRAFSYGDTKSYHSINKYSASKRKCCLDFLIIIFTFKDPAIILETSDIDVFLNEIGSLNATGGGDCPEPSFGATIRAIRASLPNSPIFVYTDARASDTERFTELQALIDESGVRIFYILTRSCGYRKRRSTNDESIVNSIRRRRQSSSEDLYSFIATYSGGQVLNVAASSISDLSSFIFQSIISSYTQILYRIGTNAISEILTFPVDETISSIIITLNGYSITNTITLPGGELTFVSVDGHSVIQGIPTEFH